jgi:hypothetical protein
VHCGRAPACDRDKLGPHLVVVAVGPDAQVEAVPQPDGGQLDLGHRPDVPGQHGLVRAALQPAQHIRGARQGAPANGDHLPNRRCLRGQACDERVDVASWLVHPCHGQSLQDDCPVGASCRWRERVDRATEELYEHHVVQVAAYSVGVKQCAVDVPEHQLSAHRSSSHPPAVLQKAATASRIFPDQSTR